MSKTTLDLSTLSDIANSIHIVKINAKTTSIFNYA